MSICHKQGDLVAVSSQRQKGSTTQFSKGTKRVAVRSIHEINKLASQLEWGTLKPEFLPGDVKKESKVNMNQIAMRIQQNVAIVSIFYLKKVADHGVCINAFYETSLGACIVVRASISCSRKSHQAKQYSLCCFVCIRNPHSPPLSVRATISYGHNHRGLRSRDKIQAIW
jgi:hypothetical protein